MDLEQLTKTQLVLLALLVSFVTSMATGIFTVSLMEQAPEPVVRTINRVVEHTVETVERIVPSETQPAQVITTETIVLSEADLIAALVSSVSPKLARLYTESPAPIEQHNTAASSSAVFIGLGVPVGVHTLMTDASVLDLPTQNTQFAHFDTPTRYSFTKVRTSTSSALTLVDIASDVAEEGVRVNSVPLALLEETLVGERAVAFAATEEPHIVLGVVTRASVATGELTIDIMTDELSGGSPIFNLAGELLGIVSDAEDGVEIMTGEQLRSVMIH